MKAPLRSGAPRFGRGFLAISDSGAHFFRKGTFRVKRVDLGAAHGLEIERGLICDIVHARPEGAAVRLLLTKDWAKLYRAGSLAASAERRAPASSAAPA